MSELLVGRHSFRCMRVGGSLATGQGVAPALLAVSELALATSVSLARADV